MLRRKNLVLAIFAMIVILLSIENGMALAVFTVDGVKMICRTCTCAGMSDAGVPLGHCVDTMRIKPDDPKAFDSIIHYSDTDVRLHSLDGKESPLASDAAQKQFEAITAQGNFKQLARLRPTAGVISQDRVASLAKELGIEIVDKEDQGGFVESEQNGSGTVLATIREGRLLSLRTVKSTNGLRLGNDVFIAQATTRGGKLILQFERPLSRERRIELKIDAPINFDRETGTSLDSCGCAGGTLSVDDANSRHPVVTVEASARPRHGHRWSTKYRTTDCPRW